MTSKKSLLNTIFVTIAFIFTAMLVFKHVSSFRMTNSDILFIESLYRDFFENSFPIIGWQILRAPSFLPDWPLYFFSRWITGDFSAAHQIYMPVILVFHLLFFSWMIKFFFANKISRLENYFFAIGLGFLMTTPLIFMPSGFYYTDIPLYDPAIHSSTFLWGFPILMLWLKQLEGPKIQSPFHLFLIGCACIIATASDLWFMFQFIIPLIASEFLFRMWKKQSLKTLFKFFITLFVGTSIGFGLPYLFSYLGWFILPDARVGEPFTGFLPFLNQFYDQLHTFKNSFRTCFQYVPIYALAAIIAFYVSIKSLNKFRKESKLNSNPDDSLSLFGLQLFFILSFLAPMSLIVTKGMWAGIGNFRYLIPTFILSFFIVGYWIIRLCIQWKQVHKSIFWLSIIAYFCTAMMKLPWPVSFHRTGYPAEMECLDAVAYEHSLKNGLSEYWLAKFTTNLSKRGLLINQMTYHFEPHFWINNYHWYLSDDGKSIREYDFFVSYKNDETRKRVPLEIGEPSVIHDCGAFDIMVFKDEKRKHFNEFLRPKMEEFLSKFEKTKFN